MLLCVIRDYHILSKFSFMSASDTLPPVYYSKYIGGNFYKQLVHIVIVPLVQIVVHFVFHDYEKWRSLRAHIIRLTHIILTQAQ